MEDSFFIFHHTCIGVKSIDKEKKIYELLGFKEEEPAFVSEKNKIRGLFMVKDNIRIELLEDLPDGSKIANQIGNRSNFIHSAYHVKDIKEAIKKLKKITICTIPSKINNNQYPNPIFLMLKNGTIIELFTKF